MRKQLFTNKINLITTSKSSKESCRLGSSIQMDPGYSNVQVSDKNPVHSTPVFSSQSRQSIMVKNLKHGVDYKTKQYEHLSSINDYLNDIICMGNSRRDSNSSSWVIYMQAIASMSEANFLNFPLFGYGTEPPIRVHLVLKGTAQIFEFNVSKLLNRPHFKSLVHSGTGMAIPSSKLLHECLKETLDEQLDVSFERMEAKKIIEELELLTRNKSKLLSNQSAGKLGKYSIFEKVYQHLFSHIFQKLKSA